MSVRVLAGDAWLSAEPIYLSDLSRCRPESALSRQIRGGHWRLLDYEADPVSGVMLVASTETGAPEVMCPLGASGWHAVSIGVFGGYSEPGQIRVKLGGDETFTVLTMPRHETTPWYRQYQGEHLWELFWRVADLTDQQLVLGQLTWPSGYGDGSLESTESMVAYIKLVPLTDEELEAYRADNAQQDTRTLFTHNDSGIHSQCPTTEEEIRRRVERYRDTDFARIYWEAGMGDRVSYFSEIGTVPPLSDSDELTRRAERTVNESWRILREKGIDPFRIALEHAHEIGLEFHAGYRVSGFHFPPPYDHFNQKAFFYRDHPELRGLGRDGQPSPRISYTYPETRQFVISLLKEIATYPVDGISLQYNRRLPVIEYEPPLLEGFQAEYCEDPLTLDEKDPRWLKYRARVMTQFMREVREAMDEASETQGRKRPIEVSAIVTSSEDENLFYGLDLEAWVEEGLIDTLIPYSSNPKLQQQRRRVDRSEGCGVFCFADEGYVVQAGAEYHAETTEWGGVSETGGAALRGGCRALFLLGRGNGAGRGHGGCARDGPVGTPRGDRGMDRGGRAQSVRVVDGSPQVGRLGFQIRESRMRSDVIR